MGDNPPDEEGRTEAGRVATLKAVLKLQERTLSCEKKILALERRVYALTHGRVFP